MESSNNVCPSSTISLDEGDHYNNSNNEPIGEGTMSTEAAPTVARNTKLYMCS